MTVGLSGSGFDIDLRNGQLVEWCLANILEDPTVEVKDQQAYKDTGNFFIEHSQPSGPSGISVTTAKYWAFQYFDECFIIVPTEKLRKLYEKAREERGVVMGGDRNRYEGVLIPSSWFISGLLRKETK